MCRYEEQTVEQALVQKATRITSGLHAAETELRQIKDKIEEITGSGQGDAEQMIRDQKK